MNDISNIGNVKSARRQIRSNQCIGATISEFTKSTVTLWLLQRAMIKHINNAFFFQNSAGSFYGFAVIAKNNCRPVAQRANQSEQGFRLVLIGTLYNFYPQFLRF